MKIYTECLIRISRALLRSRSQMAQYSENDFHAGSIKSASKNFIFHFRFFPSMHTVSQSGSQSVILLLTRSPALSNEYVCIQAQTSACQLIHGSCYQQQTYYQRVNDVVQRSKRYKHFVIFHAEAAGAATALTQTLCSLCFFFPQSTHRSIRQLPCKCVLYIHRTCSTKSAGEETME